MEFVLMKYDTIAPIVKSRLRLFLVSLLAFMCSTAFGGEYPQFGGTLRTETTGGNIMEIPFWAGSERLRMDIMQPMKMTVVWSFGELPSMLMIQHDDRVYVEWGPLQLENARRMVQRTNGGTPTPDVEILQFEETGRRATIEGWQVYEMHSLSEDSEFTTSRIWLTREADNGLVEFFSHYARALHGTTQFPMFGTENDPLGFNKGPSLPLDQLSTAIGLDGRVVRIVDDRGKNTTTLTLLALEPGPFPENLFTVPDGYVRKSQLSTGVQ